MPETSEFYRWRRRGEMCYSIDLCEDARLFAPHMSCGSRATQAEPDAQGILIRAIISSRFYFAGKKRSNSGLTPVFSQPGFRPRTGAHDGAESAMRWREKHFGD
jgi:hypothetical protein